MTKREQRVINAFCNCVKNGEFTEDYAITLIEDTQRYGWLTDAAKDAFYEFLDTLHPEIIEEPVTEPQDPEEDEPEEQEIPEPAEEEEPGGGEQEEEPEEDQEPEENPEPEEEPVEPDDPIDPEEETTPEESPVTDGE